MNQLVWNIDDHSVHIPAIDNEHKLLVVLINEFGIALQIDCSLHSQIINEKLNQPSECIRRHFASEDRFLLFNNYPEFDAHFKEHAQLLDRLDKFVSRFKTEKTAFNDRMLLFLKDWLVRHILLHDRKFGVYYLDKELIGEFG